MLFRAIIVALIATLALAAGPQEKASQNKPPSDGQTLRDYRLSVEKVRSYVSVSKTIDGNNSARQCLKEQKFLGAPTLAAANARFNSCPAAVGILKGSGLAPWELNAIPGMVMTGMAQLAAKKQGTDFPNGLSPENAAFFEEHAAELMPLLEDLIASKEQ